jgi:hypothetical protein
MQFRFRCYRTPGYLHKEIFSLRLGRAGLSWSHGAGWEADDRQGNGACRGDTVGLFVPKAINAPTRPLRQVPRNSGLD